MKSMTKVGWLFLIFVCTLSIVKLTTGRCVENIACPQGNLDVRIPFELANKTIFIQVRVANSEPLWFVLDTGDKYAVIDLSIARTLGLEFGEQVDVSGGGKDAIKGSFLKDGTFTVPGLDGFTQPLFIAVPLDRLAKLSGHQLAGVLGFDFISQFVVEIDYLTNTLTFHDKATFEYTGRGESLPITFNAAGHPLVRGQVIDGAAPSTEGAFVFDIGSGAALILNKPFVEREHFLQTQPTVHWLEGQGFGGGIDGVVGRIGGFSLGSFRIDRPVVVFSQAKNGPFAGDDSQGNIGAAILEKFKVILDYPNKRIILEPNAQFKKPLEYNRSGLSLVASGEDYKTFAIDGMAANSPASDGGLRIGDKVVSINGRPAGTYTLSELRASLQEMNTCNLVVLREGKHLNVHLKLRRRI